VPGLSPRTRSPSRRRNAAPIGDSESSAIPTRSTRGCGPADQGWRIGRNYQLFRYQLACNATGEWPTRFNGGLLTFDPNLVDGFQGDAAWFNPDFRAWGAWTAQNQRLVYWPMLRNGDFDLIRPQFEFYRKNLPNALARTHESWGIEGASFGEQIGSGGLPLGSHYGWEPPYGDRDPAKEVGLANLHATYYTSQLEMAFMLHEFHRYSGSDVSACVPLLEQVVVFHFEYFKMLERPRLGRTWPSRPRPEPRAGDLPRPKRNGHYLCASGQPGRPPCAAGCLDSPRTQDPLPRVAHTAASPELQGARRPSHAGTRRR